MGTVFELRVVKAVDSRNTPFEDEDDDEYEHEAVIARRASWTFSVFRR